MNIISALRKLLSALFYSNNSVDSILNQHSKTIDALNSRSSKMVEHGSNIEDEIAILKAKMEKCNLEKKRADAVSAAISNVFGIADEITL